MKTGYVNALAALLLASGWVLAQAPLPVSSSDSEPAATEKRADPPMRAVLYQTKEEPKEEPLDVQPTPANTPLTPVPAGPGTVLPMTNVLPRGDFVDPSVLRHFTVWGNADFLMWKINNGVVPSFAAQPPVGVLKIQEVDFNETVQNDGTVTTVTQLDPTVGYFPLRITDVPSLPNSGIFNPGAGMGARFDFGVWLTPDHLCGLDASFFYLNPRSQEMANSYNNANNQITYTTPFSDQIYQITPAQAAPGGIPVPPTRTLLSTIPIIFVRQLDSTVVANMTNSLWGGEVNFCSACSYFGPVVLTGFVGFRHVEFTEDLNLGGAFDLFTPPGYADVPGNAAGRLANTYIPSDVSIKTLDTVSCKNHFYGGNVGVDAEGDFGNFFIDLKTKLAMGGMNERVDIESGTITSTTATPLSPATVTPSTGGLIFSQLDNGSHVRDRISFIPELNLKAGYQFCRWMRGYVGYDIMYISNVARPGDVSSPLATSTNLTPSSNPTGGALSGASGTTLTVTQPAFRFADSNIWTQGFSFGLELTF